MNAAAIAKSGSFAGFPTRSWLFGLRIWISMMLALYAAFWLQLEGAASAASCVAILALQTRGQAYQKAFYRIVGTAVGACAAIVFASLFGQARDLFVLAFAVWVALSVYIAGRLDGNRAYGAQLSGYTVALVGVQLIDTPQGVFLAGLNRSAAILVGIVAISFVNDLLSAPAVKDSLVSRLKGIGDQVDTFAASRGGNEDALAVDTRAARLLAAVAALRPDITALASEGLHGKARSVAARSAALALVHRVFAVRRAADPDPHAGEAESVRQAKMADAALISIERGREKLRQVPFPLFRLREVAARNALRTLLTLILSGACFVLSGWPSTSLALSLVAVTMTLSSSAPDSKTFAIGASIAMPMALAAVGVTEFLMLDGVSEFPLLVIAMAPTILVACLMLGSGKPPFAPIGFLLLVFFPVFLSPANPQNYNPQTYLTTAVLAISSNAALFVGLTTILPVDAGRKRRWMLASARADLLAVLRGRRRSPGDLARDADRIAQYAALPPVASSRDDLAAFFWMAEMAEAAEGLFQRLAPEPPPWQAAAMRALRTLDAPALRECGESASGSPPASSLTRAVQLIDGRPDGIEVLLSRDGP